MQSPHCCRNSILQNLFRQMNYLGQDKPPPELTWNEEKLHHEETFNNNPLSPNWRPNRSWYKQKFSRPPAGYENLARLTVITVMEASRSSELGSKRREALYQTLWAQQGQNESAVAALLIMMHTTDEILFKWLVDNKLHTFPLDRYAELKSRLDLVRQTGWLDEDTFNVNSAMNTRRLTSLMGRNTDEADWVTHKARSETPPLPRTAGIFSNRIVSVRQRIMKELARRTVSKISSSGYSITLYDYWMNRGATMPGGSSSIDKNRVKKFFSMEKTRQMQVTKQTAFEVYDVNDLMHWLTKTPSMYARGSTKHEPGNKNRDLEAVDDAHAFISGYASDLVEKKCSFMGGVVSQTPKEVLRWWYKHIVSKGWWISYDYSSYNMQNRLGDIEYLNLALAKEWLRMYEVTRAPVYFDKAYCANWVAESTRGVFIKDPIHGERRVYQGLFSGSRDTMRDNTYLHIYYNAIVNETYKDVTGEYFNMDELLKSGDDEVGKFKDLIDCMVYVRALEHSGFEGKRSKMLIGQDISEFLQLVISKDGTMHYPTAPIIATLVSGNWYKEPTRHPEDNFKTLTDHIWNVAREGIDHQLCRGLVAAMCDWFYQVPLYDETEKNKTMVKLEWKKYAMSLYPNGHPLWDVSDLGSQLFPSVPILRATIPRKGNASNDLVNKQRELWKMTEYENANKYAIENTANNARNLKRRELDRIRTQWYAENFEPREGYTTTIQNPAKNETPTVTIADITRLVNKDPRATPEQDALDLLRRKRIPETWAKAVLEENMPPNHRLRPYIAAYKRGIKKTKQLGIQKTNYGLPPLFADM